MDKERISTYKYCLVPKCKNTTKSAPDKIFFLVPRGKIRDKWCKLMRRDKVSPTTPLYCCEDHFDLEEDTENYMQYKIMCLQEGQKVILHLKKNVVPHKFQCQKGIEPPPLVREGAIKRRKLALVEEALSRNDASSDICEVGQSTSSAMQEESLVCEAVPITPSALQEGSLACEAGPSTSIIYDKGSNIHDTGPSTSSTSQCTHGEFKVFVDKAVQVNRHVKYRSRGINVNIKSEQKNIAISPLKNKLCNVATSPIKFSANAMKRQCNSPVDNMSISTSSISASSISTEFEIDSPSEVSWEVENDSENEKEYKNQMRNSNLMAIERNPKIFLGLPNRAYYLIQKLTENVPVSTVHILISLRKIKLNESFVILGIQFGYAQTTVSRVFSKSIPLMAKKLKELIIWPSQIDIRKNLPIPFRARYSNVVSIIDCFEIQIEKPSNAVHQSLTWSQYKNANTLKYLISCTPDGLINFISMGYGGRATDALIVKECGYLNCLHPSAAIMADRGFKDISHMLELKKCILVRPPSVMKSTPSSKEEVRQSKRIAALRIHVERVISRIREFHMLLPHACIDHNLIPIIDEVVIIACGIINLQDVLIKK